jgi:hypothetical protein
MVTDRELVVFWIVMLGICACTTARQALPLPINSTGGESPNSNARIGAASLADDDCEAEPLLPTTRLQRLTHLQYENTVRDLLGLAEVPSSSFLADPIFAGFDNNAQALAVSDRLGRDYRRAAEELAARAISTRGTYARIVACVPSDASCADEVIARFLRRAFRRPATDTERARYRALFDAAPALSEGEDPFTSGVQLVIEAALQAPSFLYRTELSTRVGADRHIALTGYEIAARLSYALWNTMPDEWLARLADEGSLSTPEGVASAVRAMLEHERARAVVADFHAQWLELASYDDLRRDDALFPLFSSDLADDMKAEALELVRYVTFDMEGGVDELLTAPFTFVTHRTAPLYGLTGTFGPRPSRVDLDPTQRSGLLTQIGFLASHAFPELSSPIHRGVFVQRKIMCADLPDPPPGVDLVLPPIEGEIDTTREQVEAHTSRAPCASCHGMINPAGFAFEHYDAVGQFRDRDHGHAIDSSGTLRIDGEAVTFHNAIEFATALANSEQVRRCYATQWLRYLYARQEAAADRCTIAAITRSMADDHYSTKDLLADLVRSRVLMQRVAESVNAEERVP